MYMMMVIDDDDDSTLRSVVQIFSKVERQTDACMRMGKKAKSGLLNNFILKF